jgi:hypothetical protein
LASIRGGCARRPDLADLHLGFQQVGVISVLLDIGFDERALRDDLQTVGTHLVERALDQFRGDTLAPSSGGIFGMDEGDDVVGDLVVGRGDMAVDCEFVA